MVAPTLVFTDLHSEKYRFDKYWSKLSSLDVPTPKTTVISFEDGEGEIPETPIEEIQEFMNENDLQQAFIRSGYKAAIDRFRDGSIISERTNDEIKNTFESLIRQHIMNDVPHGNTLVVRECLRLDYCMEPNHSHTPEIRYFVEDGEIITKTPRGDSVDPIPDCPASYDFLEDNLSVMETPDYIAQTVADGFADSEYPWSVDIILDTNGQWWVTEMHIDAVYYNEHKDKWWNVCGHGDVEEYSPRWMHYSALLGNEPN